MVPEKNPTGDKETVRYPVSPGASVRYGNERDISKSLGGTELTCSVMPVDRATVPLEPETVSPCEPNEAEPEAETVSVQLAPAPMEAGAQLPVMPTGGLESDTAMAGPV